ncbi:Glycosyl hydrolases 32 N-terminal domain family protein [Saccharomyces cerevisiae]|nr:Glycosyl hydrolases 32 N-terminal domain family protein [Saccharomyces cerevisiae]
MASLLQYNPNDTVWGLPLFWGHATSNDLTHWQDEPVAIAPKRNDSGAYSGSMVIDHNNTSGFFNDTVDPRQRCVAIWTYNTPESEEQYISYSLDGGYTFTEYQKNPVLAANSTQFRDPKVFWLQYECPGLIEVPTEQDPSKSHWVMFISTTQVHLLAVPSTNICWILQWYSFEAFDNQSRVVDFGKDYYALQTFFNTDPTYGSALVLPGLQTGSTVPLSQLTHGDHPSEPILNISNAGPWLHFASNSTLTKANSFSVDLSNSTGTLEFELVYAVNTTQSVSKSVFSDLSLWFKGLEDPENI